MANRTLVTVNIGAGQTISSRDSFNVPLLIGRTVPVVAGTSAVRGGGATPESSVFSVTSETDIGEIYPLGTPENQMLTNIFAQGVPVGEVKVLDASEGAGGIFGATTLAGASLTTLIAAEEAVRTAGSMLAAALSANPRVAATITAAETALATANSNLRDLVQPSTANPPVVPPITAYLNLLHNKLTSIDDGTWYAILFASRPEVASADASGGTPATFNSINIRLMQSIASWATNNRKVALFSHESTSSNSTLPIQRVLPGLTAAGRYPTNPQVLDRERAIRSSRVAVFIHPTQSHPEAAAASTFFAQSIGTSSLGPNSVTANLTGQTASSASRSVQVDVYNRRGINYAGYVDSSLSTATGGSPSHIDETVYDDWIVSMMQSDLRDLLLRETKIPYTAFGIGLVEEVITNRLTIAGERGIIALQGAGGSDAGNGQGSTSGAYRFAVQVPSRAVIAADSPTDIVTRVLRGVRFYYVRPGAIGAVEVQGTFSIT